MLELTDKHILVLDSKEELESIKSSAEILPLLRNMLASIEQGLISGEEVDLGSIYFNLLRLKVLNPVTIQVKSEKGTYFKLTCATPKIAESIFAELFYYFNPAGDSGDRYAEMHQNGILVDSKKVSLSTAQKVWNKYRQSGLYIKKNP